MKTIIELSTQNDNSSQFEFTNDLLDDLTHNDFYKSVLRHNFKASDKNQYFIWLCLDSFFPSKSFQVLFSTTKTIIMNYFSLEMLLSQ